MGYINFKIYIQWFCRTMFSFCGKKLALEKCSALFLVAVALFVSGCGTVPAGDGKPVVYEAKAAPEVSTLEFIPKLKVDKKGNVIPYKASKNPYLRSSGSINKKSVEAYIQAKRAYKVENYDEVETILNGLLEKDTRLSGPWVMLGDVAIKRDQLTLAEEHFSKAISINKNNMNAYLRLAMIKRMQGDFKKAKSIYADTLTLWPDFPEAHLNLGVLYDVYLNDDVKAQKHIEAYQFLTDGDNDEVASWLLEIQERTGMAVELNIQTQGQLGKPVS